jgi:RES domain-containing protein
MVNTFVGWGRQTWTDLRNAWFMPASLPTFKTAWVERMPDRDTVPGSNAALYAGWVAYNHTVGLLIPAVALAVVGTLTVLLWIARHPARLALTAVITAALYALTLR